MIGWLKYGVHTLTLQDDLTWSCAETPVMADVFDMIASIDDYKGPADGFPGPAIFYRAVSEMGCEVLDAPKDVEADDDVY